MPWPMIAAAGAQTALSLADYLFRPKPPRFIDTPYGKWLSSKASVGKYPASMRRRLLTEAGATYGGEASKATAGIRGRLASTGMEQSIAGQRLLATPALERMKALGEHSTRLGTMNLLSREQAGEQLARGGSEYQERGRLEETGARRNLIGGLAQAGVAGVSAYYTGKTMDFDQQMMGVNTLIEAGKLDEAEKLLAQIMGYSYSPVSGGSGARPLLSAPPQESVMQAGRY